MTRPIHVVTLRRRLHPRVTAGDVIEMWDLYADGSDKPVVSRPTEAEARRFAAWIGWTVSSSDGEKVLR